MNHRTHTPVLSSNTWFDAGLGKVPPQAIELEEAVLGAVLNESGSLLIAARLIKSSEIFYRETNQMVWNSILAVSNDSRPIDLLTVTAQLRKDGNLEQVGGLNYLTELSLRVSSAANLEAHCAYLLEAWAKRSFIAIGQRIQSAAYDESADAFDILNKVREVIDVVSSGLSIGKESTVADLCREVLEDLEAAQTSPEKVFIPWRIAALDARFGGIRSPSADLIILGGFSGSGKSAAAIHIAKENAKAGFPIGYFSLEMQKKELIRRAIVAELGGEYTNMEFIKGVDVNGQKIDLRKVHAAMSRIYEAPLFFSDEGALDVYRLTLIALGWVQRGVRLIVVDSLQQVADATVKGSVTEKVSSVAWKLKALAKMIEVPIICLSTLNRESTNSADKRPHKQHLRSSGDIEFASDAVLIIYRPESDGITEIRAESGYPEASNTRGLVQIQVEKYRNGPCDVVNAWADLATNRFFNSQPPLTPF